ncbi:MAG: aspartate-semialdehyde dehydrogenase [Elusimicrobiales bacterium]|nr:aspartate-semialdehyde dehydrogenase [Elusimicrobiales bacterium]
MIPSIGVVGAGGMVGRELLNLIEKRKFPFSKVKLFGSLKKTKYLVFKSKKHKLIQPAFEEMKDLNIVFFVSSDEVSREYAKKLSSLGVWCIDDSSAFRMDKDVPLIIPEINGELINKNKKLISGPNCTLTPLAVSCWQIHKKYKIKEIRVATYQAVSGAGRKALDEFLEETKSFIKTGKIKFKYKIFPRQIAFNLFPQVGSFDEDGNSVEEKKVEMELKKIWNDNNIKLSCYAVRVPVLKGHSLAVWCKTQKDWDINDIKETLKNTQGCKFFEDHNDYQTPIDVERKEYIAASRLKKTPFKNEFSLWLCGDNLYKGAALNSIQIAELILKKYF